MPNRKSCEGIRWEGQLSDPIALGCLLRRARTPARGAARMLLLTEGAMEDQTRGPEPMAAKRGQC